MNEKIIYAEQFGVNISNYDNYEALQACLDYCRGNGVQKLIINPGVYKFHNQKTIAIKDMKDFVLEADDVEFTYINTTVFIKIVNCENVAIKGLKADWCWEEDRLASVVKSHGISSDGTYVEFEAVTPINLNQPWTTFNELDPDTMSPGIEDGMEYHPEYPNGKDCFDRKEKIGDVYRCYTDLSDIQGGLFDKDKLYIVRHHMYDGTFCIIENTKNALIENVSLYGGPGMGFIISGHSSGIVFKNLLVTKRNNNPISLIADGVHSNESDGNIVFDGCEFAFLGDDAINIHDRIHYGITKIGKFIIEFPIDIKVDNGDVLEFRNSDLSPTGFSAKVDNCYIKNGVYRIEVDSPIPESISEKSIIFNKSYSSNGYVIRNCKFHDSRARGVLVQAGDGLVENCTFEHLQGAAIQINAGVGKRWSEGTGVDGLIIRNNIIKNCDISDWDRGVIYMSTYMPEGVLVKKSCLTSTIGDSGSYCRTKYPIFKNIVIENNTVSEFPRRSVILTSFENVTLRNNKFYNLLPRKKENPERGKIYVDLGTGFVEENNEYILEI